MESGAFAAAPVGRMHGSLAEPLGIGHQVERAYFVICRMLRRGSGVPASACTLLLICLLFKRRSPVLGRRRAYALRWQVDIEHRTSDRQGVARSAPVGPPWI